MRIGLDLTPLLPDATGVDRYLTRLVAALAELDRQNRYTVFVNSKDRNAFEDLPSNFRVLRSSFRPRPARLIFQQMALPVAAAALELDVLHSPSFFLPLVRGRQRHLLSVHDMTSFLHPGVHTPLRRSRLYRAGIAASIRRADLISVPSVSVERDVHRLVPTVPRGRIRVIPYGVGKEFQPAAATDVERVRKRLGLPAKYILFLGKIEPRKDVDTLVRAYRRLLEVDATVEHLVIAGPPGWGYSELLARLDVPGRSSRVHLTGYVDSRDLPGLYAGASAFVYTSLAEGFGFPPLEAMATGVPVIASDTSSLTENLRGAAELVPVGDVAALTAALGRVLGDKQTHDFLRLAGRRRAAEFRWERTAATTLECYRELAHHH